MARKIAKCTCCSGEFNVVDMIGTAMPNRGGRTAYLCRRCAERNAHYHSNPIDPGTGEIVVQGKAKQNAVAVGIEHETSYTDEYARNIMCEYGFIPTHDCSLRSDGFGYRYGNDGNTCEYVSGIMQGLNIASKWAVTVEKLIVDGHMKVNDSCGTHTHISVNNMEDENGNKTYMGYIRRFYHSLFVPLVQEMESNPEKAANIFGRYFTNYVDEYGIQHGGYAAKITFDSDENSRYNFINVTNTSNIEFRLNKFQSAKQYQVLIKMEVEMVKCIIKNFCEHFNDVDIDVSRYYKKPHFERTGEKVASQKEYRKHKADVTAQKLVKIYRKYTANM